MVSLPALLSFILSLDDGDCIGTNLQLWVLCLPSGRGVGGGG